MPQPYSNLKDSNGTIATAGQRVQIKTTSTPCGKLTLTPNPLNQDVIVYGGSTVVGAVSGRSGTPLQPGQSVDIPIDDLSKVWLDAVVSGDGYSITWLF